jgi:hypothetical protein
LKEAAAMTHRTLSKVFVGPLMLAIAAGCSGADGGYDSSDDGLRPRDGEIPDEPLPTRPPPEPTPAPVPPPPTGPDVLIASGNGWREYRVNGSFPDVDTGAPKTLTDQSIVIVRGMNGVASAPLADVAKSALSADVIAASAPGVPGDELVYIVNRNAANQLGTPDASGNVAHASGCNDYYKNYTVDKSYSKNGSLDKQYTSGDFIGTFKANASSSGNASATFRLKVKRGSVLGVCIPYAVAFVNVRLQGAATAVADMETTGNFRKEWNYSTTITKPDLGSFWFSIGPVPIRVGFNLPIEAGVSANGFVAASLKGQAQANGSFDYTCSTGGCSGDKSFSAGFTPSGDPTGFVSGKILIRPWVQGALRVYLYSDSVAYGQVGLRPAIDLDLFGYAGNQCGDANGDGTNEWVAGTSLDSAFRLDLTAKVYALGGDWDTSYNLLHRHLGFWTGGGENPPWSPMLRVSSTSERTATIVAGNRPCWPYTEALNYQVVWGDGVVEPATRAPGTHSFVHTFPGRGTYPVTFNLLNDARGRNIGTSISRNVLITGLPNIDVGGGILTTTSR